jgi:type II restriction enzyme
MANLEFYRQHLKVSSLEDLCQILSGTLIESNHTYDFFVNWSKVVENRDAFKYEVALLKSLRNSANHKGDLQVLLNRYPEVIKVIPILLACRDGIVKVLNAIQPDIEYKTFDFSKSTYNAKEIDDIVEFTEKTGLLHMLCAMESATDYLLGVEVGLDTNARKNRSGLFLEKMVREVITDLVARNPHIEWVEQKSFSYIEAKLGRSVPASLRDRKFDHVVISKGKATNIEANFYGGTGSKPGEIVSSYINRGQVLLAAGWKFVWLTDGEGWKSMQNSLRVGVEYIDYVINAYLLRKGLLEEIILAS